MIRRQAGATLIELAVIVILILTFIVVATSRIWELRISAERVGIEQMIGTLKSALGIELAASVVRKVSQESLAGYHHCNPMTFLDPMPAHYLGEFETAPKEAVGGAWYFNRRDATVEYRIRFSDDLISENPADPALIRYQVQLAYDDLNANGQFDPAVESAAALTLVALDNYQWLSQDASHDD